MGIPFFFDLDNRQTINQQGRIKAPVLLSGNYRRPLDLVNYLIDRVTSANLLLIKDR